MRPETWNVGRAWDALNHARGICLSLEHSRKTQEEKRRLKQTLTLKSGGTPLPEMCCDALCVNRTGLLESHKDLDSTLKVQAVVPVGAHYHSLAGR